LVWERIVALAQVGAGLLTGMAQVCFRHVNSARRGKRHGTSRTGGSGYGDKVPSLTHQEAQRRAALVSVLSYDVRLDLTRGSEVFGSVSTIRFAATPGSTTFLDVSPRELHAAELNGRPLAPGSLDQGRLPLPDLRAENEIVIEATMAYSHDGEGLHRHVDPADGEAYLYAMSFLDAAPRWFACFDQPDLKATFTLRLTCPPDWTVLGNGPAERVAPGQWRIETAHPIATYFATVVAGPYHSVTAEHDGIRLGVHARASLSGCLAAEAPEMLAMTGRFLDEFHRLFGIRYPWGEYHQAFVPDFNAGAMENPGCVTLRDTYVFRSRVTELERGTRASMMAHEMAHMWFGDLVTMRWWDDLWLNESFAEYLGYRVCDAVTDHQSWVEFGAVRKAWGYAADRRPSTHPVAGNGAADAKTALSDFDGISYAKGAAVLRQLAARLGDETLLAGLRGYFHTHAYGNASFGDLISAWNAAGAGGLAGWADAWLRTSGLDTLLTAADDAAVRVYRDGADHASIARPHALSVAAFDRQARELSRAPVVVLDPVTVSTAGSAALILADAADETWAKISFDPDVWRQMPALLPAMSDQLARVAIWNALRLAVADAEIAPSLALEIVEAAAPGEPSDVMLGTILGWATETVAGVYLPDDAARALARRCLAVAAAKAMTAAEAGSGRQVTAVRSFVSACADADALGAWLRGTSLLPGMVVDDELRWAILERLASLGELDAAGIDAELARDRSTQGAVHAARCRALLPHAAAKAAAWRAMLTDTTRSNYELYAIAEGFWHPEQTAHTAPYTSRYFERIAATAWLRHGWIVGRLALLAYPRTAVDHTTLSLGDELLRREDLDAGIRRSVVDAADDLRRALAARERFGAIPA
jgi:aminopeptidase N